MDNLRLYHSPFLVLCLEVRVRKLHSTHLLLGQPTMNTGDPAHPELAVGKAQWLTSGWATSMCYVYLYSDQSERPWVAGEHAAKGDRCVCHHKVHRILQAQPFCP